MWKQLFYKWFGLVDEPCAVCEVLREQLHRSEAERKELLQRALTPPTPEPPLPQTEEMKPIQPQYIPWRVRQQILETEDKKRAELMRRKNDEIEGLEKELGVK